MLHTVKKEKMSLEHVLTCAPNVKLFGTMRAKAQDPLMGCCPLTLQRILETEMGT